MIQKRIVLIFGAGVSHEYGFPLGRSLLLYIAGNLRDKTAIHQSMLDCGFRPSEIRKFARDLYDSMQPSVDAFLELHKHYAPLGKAAMAASLIPMEKREAVAARGGDTQIYEYLWHRLSGTPGMYPGNGLSVITFNYDRSFEWFLRSALRASHYQLRDDPQELAAALSFFEVIHVYGSLGSMDKSHPSHLPYGLQEAGFALSHSTILAAAERIKLYHESEATPRTAEAVQKLLREAEVVCFLGFGFHSINVKFLQHHGLGQNAKTEHFASAYDLQFGETAAVKAMLGFEIQLGTADRDALACLRGFPVLR
jgi:hypothetical protein